MVVAQPTQHTGVAGKTMIFFYIDNKPNIEVLPKVEIHLIPKDTTNEKRHNAVSNEDGYYAVKAPPGNYIAVYFMETLDGVSVPICIEDSQIVRLDITFIFHNRNKAKKELQKFQSAHLR
jgi:hypothetical protein